MAESLKNALGEPLIKGLTEVARMRPKEPIIYLANYLLAYSNNKKARASEISKVPVEDGPQQEVEGRNQREESNASEEMEEKQSDGSNEYEGEVKAGDEEAKLSNGPIFRPLKSVFKPIDRDEHGQSSIHFAAARSHGRNAFYQLLQETDANVGLRDELYRTARDIAEQVSLPDNIKSIDKYIVSLAAKGENDKLTELMLEGYDHITDTEDEDKNIMDITKARGNNATLSLLSIVITFEERRDKLHRAIRFGSLPQVTEAFQGGNAKMLAVAKNQQGRCSLHIAVLCQQEKIVEYIATRHKETLGVGDNLMRTPLHYAMGVENVETLSKILINAGAERVSKDLKGRQPSYYFMNKSDIQALQEEEEALRV